MLLRFLLLQCYYWDAGSQQSTVVDERCAVRVGIAQHVIIFFLHMIFHIYIEYHGHLLDSPDRLIFGKLIIFYIIHYP